jgi:CRP-like cAMP-binding protein
MKDGTLRGIDVFSDFPNGERELLEKLFVEEGYRNGTVLIREVDRSASMRSAVYLVLDGQVGFYREEPPSETGDTSFAFEAVVGPPDLFDIISLATDRPHTATCLTLTDCPLAHLARPAFDELHRDHSALAVRFEFLLARQLVRDLRRLTNSLVSTFEGVETRESDPLAASLGRG